MVMGVTGSQSSGHQPGTGILITTSMEQSIDPSGTVAVQTRFLQETGMGMEAMELLSSAHQPGTGISITTLTER